MVSRVLGFVVTICGGLWSLLLVNPTSLLLISFALRATDARSTAVWVISSDARVSVVPRRHPLIMRPISSALRSSSSWRSTCIRRIVPANGAVLFILGPVGHRRWSPWRGCRKLPVRTTRSLRVRRTGRRRCVLRSIPSYRTWGRCLRLEWRHGSSPVRLVPYVLTRDEILQEVVGCGLVPRGTVLS